jgi:hypothetical protein
MSTDGWQLDQGEWLSDADLASLRALAAQWPTLSAEQQAQQLTQLQARYPELELTTTDVAMILGKIQEMGETPAAGA